MVTVDVHLHVSLKPDHVPDWWAEELYRPFGFEGGKASSWYAEDVIKLMDQAGIDIGIVMGADYRRTTYNPDFPSQHEHYIPNDFVSTEAKKFPKRLRGQASVDPLRDPQAAVMELERCVKNLGMISLKLYPTYNHFDPRDERLDALYEKAIELDIPVHFHMGWTPTINAPMKYQDPVLLDEVGIKFRKLRVVMAHLGWPWVEQGIAVVAKHPNFYCDMAYWCAFGPDFLYQAILKLKMLNAINKVIYGSENGCTPTFPAMYRNLNKVAEKLGTAKITDQEQKNIMGETAVKVYKLKI